MKKVKTLIEKWRKYQNELKYFTADELRSKCMETIQHYYSEAFDCGQVGRVEVLPISLNSVDVLKMSETKTVIESAPGGHSELVKSSTYQDIITKTAFYCNDNFYQVAFALFPKYIKSLC